MHGKVTSGKVMDSLLIEMDPYIRRFTQKLDISWVPPTLHALVVKDPNIPISMEKNTHPILEKAW